MLTLKEYAEKKKMPLRTVQWQVKNGKIPAERRGKMWFVK